MIDQITQSMLDSVKRQVVNLRRGMDAFSTGELAISDEYSQNWKNFHSMAYDKMQDLKSSIQDHLIDNLGLCFSDAYDIARAYTLDVWHETRDNLMDKLGYTFLRR